MGMVWKNRQYCQKQELLLLVNMDMVLSMCEIEDIVENYYGAVVNNYFNGVAKTCLKSQ